MNLKVFASLAECFSRQRVLSLRELSSVLIIDKSWISIRIANNLLMSFLSITSEIIHEQFSFYPRIIRFCNAFSKLVYFLFLFEYALLNTLFQNYESRFAGLIYASFICSTTYDILLGSDK